VDSLVNWACLRSTRSNSASIRGPIWRTASSEAGRSGESCSDHPNIFFSYQKVFCSTFFQKESQSPGEVGSASCNMESTSSILLSLISTTSSCRELTLELPSTVFTSTSSLNWTELDKVKKMMKKYSSVYAQLVNWVGPKSQIWVMMKKLPPSLFLIFRLFRFRAQVCRNKIGWKESLTPVVATFPPVCITIIDNYHCN